ncbi:MAG: phosphoribosylaminoimidazolesuccinocarboxamide synthase [Gemmatimonadota bacterium]
MQGVVQTDLPFPLLRRGKVREMYDLGDELLLVASDRISAFDCILPQPIPGKGAVLTQMSRFWFENTRQIVHNHCVAARPEEVVQQRPELAGHREAWAGRGMLVRRAEPFPVECVVRGYLAGSAWNEYRESGTVAGEELPEGLVEASELPSPLFSPATKAEEGHDENITYARMARLVGNKLAALLRGISIRLYCFAREVARERGIIIADTKFEFGTTRNGEIILIDEVLTPDSSRFWLAREYAPGSSPPSLDKQPVRDYLESLVKEGAWNRSPPAPDLPPEIVQATATRYRDAYRRITGEELTVG